MESRFSERLHAGRPAHREGFSLRQSRHGSGHGANSETPRIRGRVSCNRYPERFRTAAKLANALKMDFFPALKPQEEGGNDSENSVVG